MTIPYKENFFQITFDKKDLSAIINHRWCIWKKPMKGREVYYVGTKTKGAKDKQKTLYLHHLLIGKPPKGYVVDHINRDTFDNRRLNLRFATRGENLINSPFFRQKYVHTMAGKSAYQQPQSESLRAV